MKAKKTGHIDIKFMYLDVEYYEKLIEVLFEMYLDIDFEKGILWAIDALLCHWAEDNQNVWTWTDK